ncbi:MAG: MBL fold metallo-hydrolase [Spirulinaceae cyanobacterium]
MAELEPAATKSQPPKTNNQQTSSDSEFAVKFWGVRAKVATPGKNTIRYGGNTACITMQAGETFLIFDSGTGVRKLGNSLLSQMPVKAYMFFTHCHWDRIQGFPFFVPAFIPGNSFHIYGAMAANGSSFEDRLQEQMSQPNFPVPIGVMQSELKFYSIDEDGKYCLGDITVETIPLNYAHRSVAYRVNWQGHSAVCATDIPYSSDNPSPNLIHLANQADLLILNAPKFLPGTEQSAWHNLVSIAKETEIKKLILSMYSPEQNDDLLDKMKDKIQSVFPNAVLACEGMSLSVIDF